MNPPSNVAPRGMAFFVCVFKPFGWETQPTQYLTRAEAEQAAKAHTQSKLQALVQLLPIEPEGDAP